MKQGYMYKQFLNCFCFWIHINLRYVNIGEITDTVRKLQYCDTWSLGQVTAKHFYISCESSTPLLYSSKLAPNCILFTYTKLVRNLKTLYSKIVENRYEIRAAQSDPTRSKSAAKLDYDVDYQCSKNALNVLHLYWICSLNRSFV